MLDHIYRHSGETIMICLVIVFILGSQFFVGCALYSFGWNFFRRFGARLVFWCANALVLPIWVLISVCWWLLPSFCTWLTGLVGLPGLGTIIGFLSCFTLYATVAALSTAGTSVLGITDFIARQLGKRRFEDEVFLEHCHKTVVKSIVLLFVLIVVAQIFALSQIA